jgi:hypothetical protein
MAWRIPEFIPGIHPRVRHHYREVRDLDRPTLGMSEDEARDLLRPDTGLIDASQRNAPARIQAAEGTTTNR